MSTLMWPQDCWFSASLALIQIECDPKGRGIIWRAIQIAGTAAASLRPRVTWAAKLTSAARAEIPIHAHPVAANAAANESATFASRNTKAGMTAIETSKKLKAIDKRLPNSQIALKVHG